MKTINKTIVLLYRPPGHALPENFGISETDIPVIGEGELLVCRALMQGFIVSDYKNKFQNLII
jgi:NADPH-dependent curcumin reductase CurA